MDWIIEIFTNKYLVTALSSWIIAQIFKLILHWIAYKKIDLERLHGDGGMPSGHSATVMALATMCGLDCGFNSAVFAVAGIFAMVVCHDAMGVRRETGKHAEALNKLMKQVGSGEGLDLKVLVGHTPLQVFAGGFLGIGIALFVYHVILK